MHELEVEGVVLIAWCDVSMTKISETERIKICHVYGGGHWHARQDKDYVSTMVRKILHFASNVVDDKMLFCHLKPKFISLL